jgi:hypothetical protein
MPVTSGTARTRHRDPTRGVPEGLQLISFGIEYDEDQRFEKWILIKVPKNQSVAQIAANHSHPEDAQAIAKKNGIRSINRILWKPLTKRQLAYYKAHPNKKKPTQKLKRIRVPGNYRKGNYFHVLAGEEPPRVVDGYAKFSTVDRPERTGLLTFDGYDPIELEIPVRFEARGDDACQRLENDIELLERMAGRGDFKGATVGPPPIIQISVTGSSNADLTPLLASRYQKALWRVAGIDWDSGALRDEHGNRYRQLATIHVRQHVTVTLATRSATQRAKTKAKKKK